MHEIWAIATLWILLALLAALISGRLKVTTALCEIMVGAGAQLAFGVFFGVALSADEPWIKFLSGAGAIVLTFLAGAEMDPLVFRARWKEATAIGVVSFAAPFLGCTAIAYYLLGWGVKSSWLAGVALSTTSVAVVYAVMLELGLNKTAFGKTVLAACFITDLGTVITLGLIFAPFTIRTVVFVVVSLAAFIALPRLATWFLRRHADGASELETKFLFLVLFGLGALAVWSQSEAVLPAYVTGMMLAGSVGRNTALVRRLRTLTFGLLAPFYFIRAGLLVSVPAIAAAPVALGALFLGKMATKITGVYPVTRAFKYAKKEGIYTTLLMSTGLTFGSISALFGLAHGIIDQGQYSLLLTVIIGSAVVPTLIANAFFIPKHHLPPKMEGELETPKPLRPAEDAADK